MKSEIIVNLSPYLFAWLVVTGMALTSILLSFILEKTVSWLGLK